MRIAHLEYLLLFILILTLVGFYIYAFSKNRRLMARIGESALVKKMVASTSFNKQYLKMLLILAVLSLIIFALMRPQFGGIPLKRGKKGIDLVVTLDISKSMLAKDIKPSRLERAKIEIHKLLRALKSDRVGLVAFSGVAFAQCPLTSDASAIRIYLDGLDPNDMPVGGTNIGAALKRSIQLLNPGCVDDGDCKKSCQALKRQCVCEIDTDCGLKERCAGNLCVPRYQVHKNIQSAKVILLITDGEDHEGEVMESAKMAQKLGIKILTIGIGTKTGEPIAIYRKDGSLSHYLKDKAGQSVHSRLDESTLQNISKLTTGKYFPAYHGKFDTAEIVAEIRKQKTDEREIRERILYEEKFHLLVFPALLLLVIEAILFDRRRRKENEARA